MFCSAVLYICKIFSGNAGSELLCSVQCMINSVPTEMLILVTETHPPTLLYHIHLQSFSPARYMQ